MIRRSFLTGFILLLLNIIPDNQPYLAEAGLRRIGKGIVHGTVGALEATLGMVGHAGITVVDTGVGVGSTLIHGVGDLVHGIGHDLKEVGHEIITGGDKERHAEYHSDGNFNNNQGHWFH